MNKHIQRIIIGGSILLVIAGVLWIARPSTTGIQEAGEASLKKAPNAEIVLAAEESSYDFGTIAMAAGKVRHQFAVRNAGGEPATVQKLYTSCMCTEAILVQGEDRIGPFGMAGHGFLPSVNRTVAPGEEVQIEAVFDPAAHGPAGIGRIERVVTVETDRGSVELSFTATVTP